MSESGEVSQYVDVSGASAYTQNRHGADGARLLDPVFIEHMQGYCPDSAVLDAGCGAAPWAIFAASTGATAVFGIDNSEAMLGQARQALAEQPPAVQAAVTLQLADVAEVPKPDNSFDTALSINVGCALPSITRERGEAHSMTTYPLLGHFQEVARALKPGGIGIITAPASLEIPFTTFGDEDEKIAALEADLASLGDTDLATMRKMVSGHADILRATIIEQRPAWKLVKQVGELTVGQAIQRKIPGLVVPNYNHPSEEYAASIEFADLEILATASRTLPPDQYDQEAGLGKQYMSHSAFDVYLVGSPS